MTRTHAAHTLGAQLLRCSLSLSLTHTRTTLPHAPAEEGKAEEGKAAVGGGSSSSASGMAE